MSSSDRLRSLVGAIRALDPTLTRYNVVVCGVPSRVATLARATLRIASFRPPSEQAPSVPVPHAIAFMTLADGLDVVLYALPLVPAYAPLWPMALAASHVVVRLDAAAARLLDEACAVSAKKAIDASALSPAFSEDDEEAVAELVRMAIESGVTPAGA